MKKEKNMTFVQARSNFSEIVDRVAKQGETYVVSKRQEPKAVIISVDRYAELTGTRKQLRFKNIGGQKILNIEGIATAVDDIEQAIKEIRKSKIAGVLKNFQT